MEDILIKYDRVQLNRAENIILKDINIEVNRGDFVYVIGKVGSGKSTFMKSLYAEIPVESGDASVFNYHIQDIKRKEGPYLRRKIGIVFQDFQLLIDRTVEKNLEFVLRATGWKSKIDIKNRIEEVLVQVGMKNKTYKMPQGWSAVRGHRGPRTAAGLAGQPQGQLS